MALELATVQIKLVLLKIIFIGSVSSLWKCFWV